MLEAELLAAIEAGDDMAVRDLLTRGANPDVWTPDGWPALFRAIDKGRVDTVQAFLDHGAKLDVKLQGDSALQNAAFRGNVAIARMLIERGAGADVNLRGGEGNMPLKTAAEQGNIELVKLFLDAGADPECACGFDGMTALGMAAGLGHADVVQLLLDRGANPNTRDIGYDTALEWARSQNARSPSEQLEAVIRILQKATGSLR